MKWVNRLPTHNKKTRSSENEDEFVGETVHSNTIDISKENPHLISYINIDWSFIEKTPDFW